MRASFVSELAADEEGRREGGSEASFQDVARQLDEAGIEYQTPYALGSVPKFGLSDREMAKIDQSLEMVLPAAQEALARGNISFLKWEIDELLKVFRINLNPECASYRELGMAVLKEFVRALQDVARRHKGEPVNTPVLPEPSAVRVRAWELPLRVGQRRGVAQRLSFASLTTRLRGLSNCMMICP